MKKYIKYISLFFMIILLSGCVDTEKPPEGTDCTWYINDTYEGAQVLYDNMADMVNLDENPHIHFWYNNDEKTDVEIVGLKDDVEVTKSISVSKAKYEIDISNDSSMVRLKFYFNSDYIKQSSGSDTCNYPTLYYEYDTSENVANSFIFSTQNNSQTNSYLSIFNPIDESSDSQTENWCSTFYTINSMYDKSNFIIYFWQNMDTLYYSVQKYDSDVQLTDENLSEHSIFKLSYDWQNSSDGFNFAENITSGNTSFTFIDFDNMEDVIDYDENGKLMCPKGYIDDSNSNATTGTYDGNEIMVITGEKYKKLLADLKGPLSELDSLALNIGITINGQTATLKDDITTNYNLCNGEIGVCQDNAQYLSERGIKNIRSYCNEVYSMYLENKTSIGMDERKDECINFNSYYDTLVTRGIISNLTEGCSILTGDLIEKLNYFLDILKVVGPLMALGLGTLDFIKVVANGDADKEMKNAFKKFMIRLGAAALLFIIPIIIAFLLDIFIRSDLGYDSDNPFCSVIDWNE